MNIKLNALAAAMLAVFSGSALSAVPTDVPPKYLTGPLSPFVDTTNLTTAEKAAYSIYEGIMQITEGKVSATDCTAFNATISVQADGSLGTVTGGIAAPNGDQNYATVTSSGGSFRIDAALYPKVTGRGQKVDVTENLGTLNGTPVNRYAATMVFNSVNNMMTVNNARWEVEGFNGDLDLYTGIVIKDFYRGATVASAPNYEYFTIYDWGLQAVSKLNYPVEKWWQRSKVRRSDGTIARTVWVKDRLVGPGACRITIDTAGTNSSSSVFWQNGYLKVEPVIPATPVPQFTANPFDGTAGTPTP